MVDELIYQQILHKAHGTWCVSGTLEAVAEIIPASLHTLIEQHVAQLSLHDQRLLEAASVAGVEFAAAAVAAGLGQVEERVEARCASLAQHGRFLQACGRAEWPDGTVTACYRFRHALYQESVYRRLPAGRQTRWHAQIGARLAQGFGAQAGDLAAGRQALELAAALRVSALQVEVSHRLGQVYHAIGDFGRSAELQRQNVEAADRKSGTPSTELQIRSRASLALTLSALGAFAEGRRHGEEALRLATLAGRGVTPIIAHGCLGIVYLTQGDLEPAIQVLEQGLTLCRASGILDWLRPILVSLGFASALQGRLAEGRALLEEAISVAIHTGGTQRPLWVAWLSEVCRLAGRGEEAWQHARQALDLARQLQDRGDEAVALHQLGTVHAHTAPPDAEQAEAHYQQALALADTLGMRPLVAHCYLGLGQLYFQTGRAAQAHTTLCAAVDLYRAMDMTFWLHRAEATLGVCQKSFLHSPLRPSAT